MWSTPPPRIKSAISSPFLAPYMISGMNTVILCKLLHTLACVQTSLALLWWFKNWMSSFSSGRFAVCKNTTDNKLKENSFLRLKTLVHVEPVWFSLDNLTLCAALTTTQWLCTRLRKIWDELKLFSYERDDFFLLVSSNIETSCQQNKKKFR